MYKVLIVDDETLAIRYLSTLVDWAALNFDSPLTAMTESRAVELFTANRVDIMMVDVRMPETDGLTLVEKLRKINPDFLAIILTAYRDFEVVQRSVQAGVCAFLLKHDLDAGALTAVLSQATLQLEQDRRMRRAALSHWLSKCLRQAQLFPPPANALAPNLRRCLIFLKYFQWAFLDPYQPPDPPLFGTGYPLLAEESYAVGIRCVLCAAPQNDVRDTLAQIKTEGAIILLSACYCSSSEASDLGLPRFLKQCVLPRGNVCMSASDFWAIPEAAPVFPANYAPQSQALLRAGRPELEDWVLAPLQALDAGARCRVEDFSPLCQLLTLLRSEAGVKADAPEMLAGFSKCDSLGSVITRLRTDIRILLSAQKDTDGGAEYARRAAKLIQENYGRQLRMADIARELYISEGYLRAVFKRAYGCTVSEYLRNTRIDAACALLRSNKYLTYEIADMCGFANGQHFNQVFRQKMGISPRQYALIYRENQ